MDAAARYLYDLTSSAALDERALDGLLGTCTADELGLLFVRAMLLPAATQALVDARWLRARGAGPARFAAIVDEAFGRELATLQPIATPLRHADDARLRQIGKAGARLSARLALAGRTLPLDAHRAFVRTVCDTIARLVRADGALRAQHGAEELVPLALHRAFDPLDRMFALEYEREEHMVRNATRERLYEGSGCCVQTHYSTIFEVLDLLALPAGAHLVDLGAGFGRVGLVAGLWRDDVRFTGFEYVAVRNELASAAAQRAGIDDRIHFVTQDLADPTFALPDADVYYLYDPFSEETYRRVLARLVALGQRRAISVVTKGNAGPMLRALLRDIDLGAGWREHGFDLGNLVVFRSA